MSARERRKGAAAEREVVALLRDQGWPGARRTSDGRGQASRGDVTNGPAATHFEVKRVERLAIWSAIAQAEADARAHDLPVVAFRRSRSGWYAALPLDELLALLRLREAA